MREMKDSGIEWIKQIPTGWSTTRGKNILQLMKRPPEADDEVITCFRDGEVTLRRNRREEGFTFSDKEIGYQGIKKGDLVIHGMDGFAGAIGISDSDGKGSPVLVVCTTKENTRYLMYYLRTLAMQDVFLALATGIRERSCDLRWNKIADLLFPVPELNEQCRIADYLDRKCSQIDAIIARQQEVIEKLKAYKLSIITEAVTKGLNPNVPMKDSGVEWIGEIPEHWQVPKIKYLATIASGGTPDRSHPEYWNGSINWAKTGELQNNELYETEEKITELALENSSAKVFSVDTILVAMYGQGKTRGMTALLKVPSATNQACAGITVYSKDITVSYLWLFLMGAYDAIREKANGSGQPNLSGALIADFNVTLPPIEEQMNICKTVAMRLPHIDSIIKQKETIVDKLTAYKKSLIYEVVTGKKEV